MTTLIVSRLWCKRLTCIHALPSCGGGLLGYYSCFAILWWWTFITGTSIIFVFCCDKSLLQHKFCCNKNILLRRLFVVTNILLTRQTYSCLLRQKYACCDKSMFVATNICCNKSFVMTNTCLLQQTYFCCNKHILVVMCFVMTNTHFLQLICCDKCVCRDKTFAWQKRYLWQLPSMIDFWGITDALQPCESGLWGIILVMPPCDGAPFGVFLAD